MTQMPCSPESVAALIPARAGSKRLASKNVRLLDGHPLLAYTIEAALQSGIFNKVLVSTDSEQIAEIARRYGAETPFLRPEAMATDHSPDIDWILHALNHLEAVGSAPDCFSLLRPTSPFRQPETILRAWDQFRRHPEADSLRAVEPCKQHPAKMWKLSGAWLSPLLDDGGADPPWHSSAYQSLPQVWAQNASLEIAWYRTPLETHTIAGRKILAFQTEGYEGFDINQMEDFLLAEILVERKLATLPFIGNQASENNHHG